MAHWKRQQILTGVALSILFFFSAVSVMHALVPHEHPHDSFVSEYGLPVHNTAGEKYFLLLMLAGIAVLFPGVAAVKAFFVELILRGRRTRPDAAPPRIYAHLFAQGILHSKAY